jgi:hypothetical protein
MIIVYRKVEYVVSDRFGSALRRSFRTADARRHGLGTGPMYDFLRGRIVPWYQEAHHVTYAQRPDIGVARPLVPRQTALWVMTKFRDKLIAKWLDEGYIVRLRRGTYKLNPKRARR